MAPSVLEEMTRPRTSQARSPRRARFPRNQSLRTEEVMRLPFAMAGSSGTGGKNCCDTITANMSGVVLGDTSPSASTTIPLQTTPIHGPQLTNGNNLMMTTNTLLSSKDALQHLQQQQQHLHMQQHNPPGATNNNNSHIMSHNMHPHLHHHSAFPARPSPQDELMEGDPALPFV